MRRTPLKRRTPLGRIAHGRPRPRPRADRVTPDLVARVAARDRGCVAARLGFEHECATRFGDRHAPTDVRLLEVEHVKADLRMGVRAEPRADRLVLLCGRLNALPPTKVMRAAFRLYLREVEPS